MSGCNIDINLLEDFPFVDQDGSNWCWAASISETVEYFTDEEIPMQQIVTDHYGEVVNKAISGAKDVAKLIDRMGYLNGSGYAVDPNTYNGGDMNKKISSRDENPISKSAIVSHIDDGIPMIMYSGNHISVITGYIFDNETGNGVVICRDSNYYTTSFKYENLKPYNIMTFTQESGGM